MQEDDRYTAHRNHQEMNTTSNNPALNKHSTSGSHWDSTFHGRDCKEIRREERNNPMCQPRLARLDHVDFPFLRSGAAAKIQKQFKTPDVKASNFDPPHLFL